MSALLLKGGTLIDGTGSAPLPDAAVLIEDGKVAAVGKASEVQAPAGATVIDTTGKTILPGLIDVHVHLATNANPGPTDFMAWNVLTPENMKLMHGVFNARRTLEAGFTTVRNMGYEESIALRDAVSAGYTPGPRMLTSGFVNQTGGHSDMFTPGHFPRKPLHEADGPDGCRKNVRQWCRLGVDFIKICTTGGVMSKGDDPNMRNYTPAEIAAITEEAHALGRRVAAHAQVPAGIKNAILNGVDTIEHGNVLDDECIELMVRHGTYLVPTLAVVYQIIQKGPAYGMPEYGLAKARAVYETHRQSIARAYKAGVKIAMGTDAAFNICRCGDNAIELELMVDVGMSPMDVLVATTRVAAEAMGLTDVGTLTPGLRADALVVDGDPLADIKVLQDKSRIHYVIQAGKVAVDRLQPGVGIHAPLP